MRAYTTTLFGLPMLFVAAASAAQISFLPAPARQVADGPSFVSVGDFNGDGIGDAVVSSTVRPRIAVLFGSPSGEFCSGTEFAVGQLPGCNTTGDFNGDGINDIAVCDKTEGRVFIINGRGENGKNDGTFSAPESFAAAPRGPVAITTGNFDNRPGLDIATANGNNNTFTVFTNEGDDRGLRALGNFPTGLNPRAIVAHDFNGDGVDDIAVLDTGARGNDEVSLFLNTGTGTFSGVTPETYVVGAGAKAMVLSDFNNDHKMDLAVLNTAGVGLNAFSISILLGQDSPRFRVLQPAVSSCPSRINGIPVNCTPQDIKAADFDSDTLTDLAVSFSTTATDNSQTTSGFVNAYVGRGDGSFDFAAEVIVGLGPRGIAAADVTGDAVPDLVVTEFTNNAVRALLAKRPPPKQLGEPCVVGSQCDSMACVDGVCCSISSCPGDQRCDVQTSPGICAPPAQDGEPCRMGLQCSSLFCIDSFCCHSHSCAPGEFCNTGQCRPPASNGTPCTASAQCSSGVCTDGLCCTDAHCAINAACNIPGNEGSCFTRLGPGSPCTAASQCCSSATDPTMCDPSFCLDGFCCEKQCATNESCGLPDHEGICSLRPAPTSMPAAPLTSTPRQDLGYPCTTAAQCNSGHCVDDVCCATCLCDLGERCDVYRGPGTCRSPRPLDAGCDKDSDCEDGLRCAPGRSCAGDCDNSGAVTVDEIVFMVARSLDSGPLASCERGDVNTDGSITVNEILTAVSNVVEGCPSFYCQLPPAPTPTVLGAR